MADNTTTEHLDMSSENKHEIQLEQVRSNPNPKEIQIPVPPANEDGGCGGCISGLTNQLMAGNANITEHACDFDSVKEQGDNVPYQEHQGAKRQYMRDMILGANDGLVSVFLLIIGLAGGDSDARQLLLAALVATVGGAISMALGEYLATKSQKEVYIGDIELEKIHFKYHRAQEIAQVRAIMQNDLMLEGELLEQVVEKIGGNDEALMKIMMAFEFGLNEADDRSPLTAMLMSGGLFIGGALPTFLPFFFTNDTDSALIASAVLSGAAMFLIGSLKTIATRGNWFFAGLENFLIGSVGGALSFGVGSLYDYVRNRI